MNEGNYNFVQTRDDFATVESAENYIASFSRGSRTLESAKNELGEWSYTVFNSDRKKAAEYSSPKTLNGITKTVDIAFEYDDACNLIKETATERVTDKADKVFVTDYEYNKQNKIVRVKNSKGMISETLYDKKGNVEKTQIYHISNPTAKIINENKENSNTIYGVDPYTNETLSISASSNNEPNCTKIKTEKGLLTELAAHNAKFSYTYDNLGRKTSVDLNGENYVKYEFSTVDTNEIVTALYANGEGYETVFDKFGKVLKLYYIKQGAKVTYIANEYDAKDRIVKSTNYLLDEAAEYNYDESGNMTKAKSRVILDSKFDIYDKVLSNVETIGDRALSYEYKYDEDLNIITLPTNDIEKLEQDAFGRVCKHDTPILSQEKQYVQVGEKTSNLVASVTQRLNNGEFSKQRYLYDTNGNISKVYEAGNLITRYSYDEINRLIREDNAKLGRTYTYEYDTNGNILYKNKYNFSFEDNLFGGENLEYRYEQYKLVKYAEDGIGGYDELGNPKFYRNHELKWSHLRNLAEYDNIKMKYDENGLRLRKKVKDKVTEYFWSGSKLVAEKQTIHSATVQMGDAIPEGGFYCYAQDKAFISYLYGAEGVCGFKLESDGGEKVYYYRKNLHGDIVGIYDQNCVCVAEYTYDAWGNHIVTNHTAGNIGDLNPIRYRGYYYDTDLGMYYLKSRYYDPETCRFINMDSIQEVSPYQVNGLNLYAYCGSNPIMNIDPNGNSFLSWFKKATNTVGNFFTSSANWVDNNVISPTINWVASNVVAPTTNWVDNNVVKPTTNWISNNVLNPIGDGIYGYIKKGFGSVLSVGSNDVPFDVNHKKSWDDLKKWQKIAGLTMFGVTIICGIVAAVGGVMCAIPALQPIGFYVCAVGLATFVLSAFITCIILGVEWDGTKL
jgi:RHS repeat-associated protein